MFRKVKKGAKAKAGMRRRRSSEEESDEEKTKTAAQQQEEVMGLTRRMYVEQMSEDATIRNWLYLIELSVHHNIPCIKDLANTIQVPVIRRNSNRHVTGVAALEIDDLIF